MARIYSQRYGRPRWAIVCGSYHGIEEFAANELQRALRHCVPYVIEVMTAAEVTGADTQGALPAALANPDALDSPDCPPVSVPFPDAENLVVIGTLLNNPLLRDLARQGRIAIPSEPESYCVICINAPWASNSLPSPLHESLQAIQKAVFIAGADARGVLYGVEEFAASIVASRVIKDLPDQTRQALDQIEPFTITERPLISNRGLWGWGYVIYDYRRFIDRMARLRMNTLVVWNDCPPINCDAVIEYAHSRGVRLILGFHWGWGFKDLELSNPAHRAQIRDGVLRNYHENYQGRAMDGIYFQTLTEHMDVERGGESVASAATLLVNEISAELFKDEPDLLIQFGLHATSILDRYMDLRSLDPRIIIVWEDAGMIPYSYNPVVEQSDAGYAKPRHLDTAERTIAYSKEIAVFRPGTEFAMVAKGWICLRWLEEFEHHGPFILGERDASFIQRRLEERQPRWNEVNALWLQNYPLAARFYREVLDTSPVKMTVIGLIEDGSLEERIQPSVALFAETLWNPRRSDAEILQCAMSPWYRE